MEKKSAAHPTRGLKNDPSSVPVELRRTSQQKSATLDLMLNQIANWCPVIARLTIVNGCTSINDIWQKIRLHYNIQKSGSQFLDLAVINLQPDEKPEDLYQRLVAFYTDNLLEADGDIEHHGEKLEVDEEITPAIENTIVVLWLQHLNPCLPQLVKQRYGTELRNRSLASIKPEISQALPSLLDELKTLEDSKVFRASVPVKSQHQRHARHKAPKSCILCKSAGRPHTSHFLSNCTFLPAEDRRALAKARYIHDDGSDVEQNSEEDPELDHLQQSTHNSNILVTARRVDIVESPFMNVFYKHHPIHLTIDCGATTSMIKASCAEKLKVPIVPASQLASQADGHTPLRVLGEVHMKVSRGTHAYSLDALVVNSLDVDILAGNNFLSMYDIVPRLATKEIIIGNSEIIKYNQQPQRKTINARRIQAHLVRSPTKTVLLPGDYITIPAPQCTETDSTWALEPSSRFYSS